MHCLELALLFSILLVAAVDISQAQATKEKEIKWDSIKAVRFNREGARSPMDYARGKIGFKTFRRRNPLRRRYRERVRARRRIPDGDFDPRTWGRRHYPP